MQIDSHERILLTGAGFTKNFGGPLAKELWGIIYSSPKLDNAPDVRDLLRRDFDFESVYNQVLRGARLPFDDVPEWPVQQQALRTAVVEAYAFIDDKIRAFSNLKDAPNALDIYGLQRFISKFAGTEEKPGFFFTLNQDLFLERHHYNGSCPTLLGIPDQSTWFKSNSELSLPAERCVLPETAEGIGVGSSDFYYIKLHGSSNWYSADQETMVIGRAKEDQIAAQPLLALYYEIFQAVLTGERRRLLCLGYSFSDRHINQAIEAGVKAGLRLYVLSPEAPDALAARLIEQGESGEILWRGLAGYFQADLKTLFPVDQSSTADWKMLSDRFFG
jgi:hypothetical protein